MRDNLIFSYVGLIECLKILSRQSSVFPLCDWQGQAGVVLRHDVDLDVVPALALAVKEAEAGIRGSFFFMTTAATYNLSAPRNRSMIREMVALGFEIALHFDPLVYPDQTHSFLADAMRREADLVSNISGVEIRSVSIHNPSVHGKYPLFEGFKNAYDPNLFSPDRYLSDSRMLFRNEPVEFFSRATHKTMQLLLHPLHYSENAAPYPAAMLAYLKRTMNEVEYQFGVNSTFREKVGASLASTLAEEARQWAIAES